MEVRDTLTKTPPGRCRSLHALRFVHLFVDGSWEGGVAGLGAAFFDVKAQRGRVWQGKAPQAVLDSWRGAVYERVLGGSPASEACHYLA